MQLSPVKCLHNFNPTDFSEKTYPVRSVTAIGQKKLKDVQNLFNKFPSKETRSALHDMWFVNMARDRFFCSNAYHTYFSTSLFYLI